MSAAAALKLAGAVAMACSLALLGTAVQAHAQSQPGDSTLAAAAGPVSSLPQAGPRLHTRCSRAGPVQLTIRTVPAFEGVRFTFGGAPFVSDASGLARITAPQCGTYSLGVERNPGIVRPGVRATFARWGDNVFTPQRPLLLTQARVLEIGFEVDYLVKQSFVDLAGKPVATSRITRVAQSNSLGSRESFVPGSPRWLSGTRIMRRSRGLQPTEILYSVREVLMNGSNVVRRAEQRFYPARTRHVRIAVLLYSAVVRVRDRFFGFPLGSNIEVVYPDGHSRTFPLGKDSTVVLRSLPRGTYDVQVDAPGMSPKVPIALTRDQLVELRILSYLDLLVLFGSLGFVAVAMLLWRRPVLRGRLRRPLQGARGAAAAASATVRRRSSPVVPQEPVVTAASDAPPRRRVVPTLPRLRVGAAVSAAVAFVGSLVGIGAGAVVSAARAVATFVGVLLSLVLYPLEWLVVGVRAFGRGVVRGVGRAAAGAYGALSALRPRARQRTRPAARPVAAARVPRTAPARRRGPVAPAARTVRHVQVLGKRERAEAALSQRVDVATRELADAPKESLLALAAALARDVRDEMVAEQRESATDERTAVEPRLVPRLLLERIVVAAASRGRVANGAGFKWSISGGLVDQTRAALEELVHGRLDDVSLASLVLDRIELAHEAHVVALGVTPGGSKLALGLWAASDDGVSPATSIEELAARGLHAGEELVVLVDGSQALRRAVGDGVRRWVPVGPHRADVTIQRWVPVRRRAVDIQWRGRARPGEAAAGRWAVRARPVTAPRHAAAGSPGDAQHAIRARHRPVVRGAQDG